MHKVLIYVEYRAVSGVFQNIDPPPPYQPASVYPPPLVRGRTHLLGGEGVGGQYFGRRQTQLCTLHILEDARYWIGLLQCNLSTIVCICNTEEHAGCKLAWSGKSVIIHLPATEKRP
jgi:hypothetical protein